MDNGSGQHGHVVCGVFCVMRSFLSDVDFELDSGVVWDAQPLKDGSFDLFRGQLMRDSARYFHMCSNRGKIPFMLKEFLQPDNTIDVISPSSEADYELFFGPIIPGTKPLVMDFDSTTGLLVHLGLAQSKGWCRKNNWDNLLDEGYQELTFGSKRYKICILR